MLVKQSAKKTPRGSGEAVLCFCHMVLSCALNVAKKHATVAAESNHVGYTFQCSPVEVLDLMKQFLDRSVVMEPRATLPAATQTRVVSKITTRDIQHSVKTAELAPWLSHIWRAINASTGITPLSGT